MNREGLHHVDPSPTPAPSVDDMQSTRLTRHRRCCCSRASKLQTRSKEKRSFESRSGFERRRRGSRMPRSSKKETDVHRLLQPTVERALASAPTGAAVASSAVQQQSRCGSHARLQGGAAPSKAKQFRRKRIGSPSAHWRVHAAHELTWAHEGVQGAQGCEPLEPRVRVL